jgi:potassium channel LctB
MIKKINEANRKIKENIGLFRRIWNLSLNHFFITFITLYILSIIFLVINQGTVSVIIGFVLLAYFISFLVSRVQMNIAKLLHHELTIREILIGYVTSVLFIIVLFAIAYWGIALTGTGYLRYGECIDNTSITKDTMLNDPNLVIKTFHYPYFSAITFFTVGYGDICPMGLNKTVAVLNALIGSAFNVLILAIAITNYATKTNGKK